MKRGLALLLLLGSTLCASGGSVSAEAIPPELLATSHSGWLWSNPVPQGDSLGAVEFAGDTGFAAGEEGTVLKSLDGGASWTALSSGTTEKLSLMQVLDPATVFVSGNLGLLESTNGGASFREIRSEKPCYECSSIRSFSFLSATSGVVETYDVFTRSDSLLWTENGGASFEARTPVPLYAAEPGPIRFLSSTDGVALVSGENIGRVMRTVDGGRTWTIAAEGHHKLSGLTFATSLLGYAVGEDDTILRTDDGGATWQATPLVLPAGAGALDLTGISCAEAEACLITTNGLRSTNAGPILRTTDGGRSATLIHPFAAYPGPPAVLAVADLPSNHAVAVGGGGATALSADGGASFADDNWRAANISEPYEEPPTQIRLGRSPREAFLPGQYGRIAVTRDAGHSWNVLQLPTNRLVLDAAFPTPQKAFAVVKGGAVYATGDGGRSWRRCGRAARSPGAVLATNQRVVLVTGGHGVWRSTDGCGAFTQVGGKVAVDGRLRPLESFELSLTGGAQQVSRHTMIVFANQILESTDAGERWAVIPGPGVTGYIEAVSFLGARSGYVLREGTFFFTNDQGRHWRRILTVAPEERHAAEYPSISFSSLRDGFIATHNSEDQRPNIVFRTEDAGRSWIPEEMPEPIASIIAAPGIAYSASTYGDMFIARGGGFTGERSRITLRIAGPATLSPRALARAHHYLTVHGRITPALSGVPVTVARTTGREGWSEETAVTGAGGRFSYTFDEVESTTWIDAYWTGSPGYRGAATGPVILRVRR